MRHTCLFTGSALLFAFCFGVIAQPVALTDDPTAANPAIRPPMAPPISLAELEKFIGGRTMLTLKLQDATLEEAATAMSQSSGLNITARPLPNSRPVLKLADGQPIPYTPPEARRFTLQAKEQPFWDALFAWKQTAQQVDWAAWQEYSTKPRVKTEDGRNTTPMPQRMPSFNVQKRPDQKGFWLSSHHDNPDYNLPDGRGISAWPLVMLMTTVQRTQNGQLDLNPWARRNHLMTRAMHKTLPQPPHLIDDPAVLWFDRLGYSLLTFFDPKVNPLKAVCEVEEAIDDRGNDLRPPAPSNRSAVTLRSSMIRENQLGRRSQIVLQTRPGLGQQLKKLRGVFHFTIAVRTQRWEITDVQQPAQHIVRQGGEVFGLKYVGLEKSGPGWRAKFALDEKGETAKQLAKPFLSRPLTNPYIGSFSAGGSAGGPGQGEHFFGVQDMALVDDQGRTFTASNYSYSYSGRGEAAKPGASPPAPHTEKWTYLEQHNVTFLPIAGDPESGLPGFIRAEAVNDAAQQIGKPVKLIIDIPMEMREVSVPFEFTDLPLPPS